jgi:hypothetical protein
MKAAIVLVVAVMVVAVASPSAAQTYNSGSTGALGTFQPPYPGNPNCATSPNCTVDLPENGELHYTDVTIPAGWVVKFKKNTANTPVVIRASGNVTIVGTIDVSGANGGNAAKDTTALGPNGGAGGPGGFSGGSGANGLVSTIGGAGGGPGGGNGGDAAPINAPGYSGGGAGFVLAGIAAASPGGVGGPPYGTAQLLPIVGGSGGGGGGAIFGHSGAGGGGGGGALLIAASGTITFAQASGAATILAKGGNGGIYVLCCPTGGAGGGGSGGAVRLVATAITSTGNPQINVSAGTAAGGAGNGSRGRIRIEAYTNTANINLVGSQASVVLLPRPAVLPNTPTLRITAVGGISTPTTPAASLGAPDVVLPATTTNPVQISLAAAQVPLGTTILVSVRGLVGAGSSVVSNGLTGTVASSTATANVTLPTNQPSIITASATFDLVASSGAGPVYVEGERIERIRVATNLEGAAQITYITASGREIAAISR